MADPVDVGVADHDQLAVLLHALGLELGLGRRGIAVAITVTITIARRVVAIARHIVAVAGRVVAVAGRVIAVAVTRRVVTITLFVVLLLVVRVAVALDIIDPTILSGWAFRATAELQGEQNKGGQKSARKRVHVDHRSRSKK
jgi:hypothetical protein